MDDATRKTALQALRSELAELQGDADTVRDAIGVLERRAGAAAQPVPNAPVGHPTVTQPQVVQPPSVPAASTPTTGAFVERIVTESDRTWNLGDLVDELLAQGWVTRSEKPTETVRAALIPLVNKGTVERVAPGVYGKPRPRQTDAAPQAVGDLLPMADSSAGSTPSWPSDVAEPQAQEVR